MIQVQVLPFGVLKDRLGASPSTVELPEGATVASLLDHLNATNAHSLQGIAVSVNAEYASASHTLHEGDEVGLLPPVSGGTNDSASGSVKLTHDLIDSASIVAAAKHAEDGAIVVFDGIVRNHSRNRQTLHLDYEAYEEMALNQMRTLAAQAREKYGVRHVTMIHRLGRLNIGETSVLIVVASAHRAQAYEASRWLIDTLKKTVPIWKRETFVDGSVWAAGEPFPDNLAIAPAEAAHDA
ncbi:MAG: molybdenum cofactor biosynthesis protein MoaE [Terracidiphilus sp.]|jgi:molybdopterin synthase catalytic subunit